MSIPSLRLSRVYDIVHTWMANALETGRLQPKPDPMIVGEGLESIQLALDTAKKGVSATKVVVRLSRHTEPGRRSFSNTSFDVQ